MSKENELLKGCLSLMGSLRLEELRPLIKILNEIEHLLAQPKQEPLSNEDLKQMCEREKFAYSISQQLFNTVARRIEKAHGIGADDE